MINTDQLKISDPAVYKAVMGELKRQKETAEMIASENFVSIPVLQALGTWLTNKYSEGYPHKRYYGGNDCVDERGLWFSLRMLYHHDSGYGGPYDEVTYELDKSICSRYFSQPWNHVRKSFAQFIPVATKTRFGARLSISWRNNFRHPS